MTFRNTPHIKEMAMAFIGFTLWTFGDALIRFLKPYPIVLTACISSLFAVLLMCVFSRFLGGFRDTFGRPQLFLRIFRGILLACTNFLVFVAFTNLDLATAYALVFAAPFIAKILSIMITGENIRLRSWIITALGFLGVLMVLRPGYVPIGIGSLAALGVAALFAWGYVLTRYIQEENQTFLSMCFFQYAIVSACLAFPAYQSYNAIPVTLSLDWPQYIALFVIGATAVAGSIFVSTAYSRAPTATIAPIHYCQILWGTLFSALFFAEYPDLWTIIGATIITISGIALIKFTRPVA